jgi:hypothetical protein
VVEDEGQWDELRERFARQEIEALVDAVFTRMTATQPARRDSRKRRREEDHDRATIARTVLALWEFLHDAPPHEALLVRRCLALPEDLRPRDEFPA